MGKVRLEIDRLLLEGERMMKGAESRIDEIESLVASLILAVRLLADRLDGPGAGSEDRLERIESLLHRLVDSDGDTASDG
ncbi:MAG: hypothetical protein AB7H43_15670 [Acidimicrobiia bacterium]